MMRPKIYPVSVINRYIKDLLMREEALNDIYVSGEVSNCKYHTSGHIYFTLKDKGGAIACVMFAGSRNGLKFRLAEGMAVTVFGSIGVYEQAGRYQLYARAVSRQGTGQLYEAYEALKKKLLAEGLFDQEHKKKLPAFPRRLGVVTARTGAAIQDIINVSRRRDPYIQIVFCSAQVQGEGAAASVASAIRAVEAAGVDVMIVGRGGGSIEDLWAFNEEAVARCVYDCSVPVISAVGHETDTTIIDYVADMRAPTPSAAAEMAVPDIFRILREIEDADQSLRYLMQMHLSSAREQTGNYSRMLNALSPAQRLADMRQRLMDMEDKMSMLMTHRLDTCRAALAVGAQRLEGMSPLRQLARGYAYVHDEEGHGITTISQVSKGQMITAQVTDGEILAQVAETRHREERQDG